MIITRQLRNAWNEHLHKMRLYAYNDPLMRSRMTHDGLKAVGATRQDEPSKEPIRATLLARLEREGIQRPHELRETGIDEFGEFNLPVTSEPVPKAKTHLSVTKIIGGSKSDQQLMLLERWKRKKIAELGVDGFAQWQRDRFALGHAVHREIERFYQSDHNHQEEAYLEERIDQMEEKAGAFLVNIQPLLLNQTEIKITVKALEHMVKHPTLPYYGIVDCIAKIDGFGWAVIDWKTSDRRKQELNECWDDPIQIAAYCAMLGLNRGALVKMYEDKNPDVIMMEPNDVNYYWQLFAERYDVYVERNRRFIKN